MRPPSVSCAGGPHERAKRVRQQTEQARPSMNSVEERLLPSAEPVRLLDQNGVPHDHPSYRLPDRETLLDGYAQLIRGRRFNDQASALLRQGRLAVYPSSHGQEACQIAATMVLREGDWRFPTYRDSVSIVSRGVDPIDTLTLL